MNPARRRVRAARARPDAPTLLSVDRVVRTYEAFAETAARIVSVLAEKRPSERLSRPEEIAALALWLTNPLAHHLTGTAIPVDEGRTAR